MGPAYGKEQHICSYRFGDTNSYTMHWYGFVVHTCNLKRSRCEDSCGVKFCSWRLTDSGLFVRVRHHTCTFDPKIALLLSPIVHPIIILRHFTTSPKRSCTPTLPACSHESQHENTNVVHELRRRNDRLLGVSYKQHYSILANYYRRSTLSSNF